MHLPVRHITSTLFLLLFIINSHAQYRSAPVWAFGDHAGIDFKTGSPVPVNTNIYTHSAASATQCDAQGNILFYANAIRTWDRTGTEMPGSFNPVHTSYLSGQALQSIIVPDAADAGKYFIFNIFPSLGNPPYGPYYVGQLTYSVVDMNLRGGLGDIVPGKNHLLLDTDVGNYMQVVPDDQCNLWLVVHSGIVHTFKFRCYKITAAGITTTPVVSSFPFIASAVPAFPYGVDNRSGNMIYSYTRDKLFLSYNAGDLYAYDFNRATGAVTNPQLLGWNYAPTTTSSATLPGICLSPDERFLYTCGYTFGNQFELRQYPIITAGTTTTLGTPNAIFNTSSTAYIGVQQPLGFYYWESNMQRGPDNKIYMVYTLGQNFLACINNPDLPGAACNFNPIAVTLQPNTYSTSALPTPSIERMSTQPVEGTSRDTAVCFENSILLQAPDPGYLSYEWQNGQKGRTLTVTQSGTYIVKSSNYNCKFRSDTFNVTLTNFDVSLGRDTTICEGIPLRLTAAVPGATITWQDGSSDPWYTVDAPGRYAVKVTKNGCTKQDSINVKEEVCDCVLALPSVFSPNADGRNDDFHPVLSPGCPVRLYRMNIYNRWGELVFATTKMSDGWNGNFKGTPADAGTYMYYVEFQGGREKKEFYKGDITLIR